MSERLRRRIMWKLVEGPVWRLIDWHEGVHRPNRFWCPLCMARMRGAVRAYQEWWEATHGKEAQPW